MSVDHVTIDVFSAAEASEAATASGASEAATASETNTIDEERARTDLNNYIRGEVEKGRFYPVIITELNEQIDQMAAQFTATRQFNKVHGQYLYDAEIMLLAELLFSRYPQYINPLAPSVPINYGPAVQRLEEEYEHEIISTAARGEKFKLVVELVEVFINRMVAESGQPIKLGLRRILQVCEQVAENVYNIYDAVPAFAAMANDDPYIIAFLNKAISHYFASFWVVAMD